MSKRKDDDRQAITVRLHNDVAQQVFRAAALKGLTVGAWIDGAIAYKLMREKPAGGAVRRPYLEGTSDKRASDMTSTERDAYAKARRGETADDVLRDLGDEI